MTKKTVRGCSYTPLTNTLSLTESFIKKASRLGTAEYKMVLQFQKDHPDLKMVAMENKASEHKRDTVTYARMEKTIKACRDKETRMMQYERMQWIVFMRRLKLISRFGSNTIAMIWTKTSTFTIGVTNIG